MSTPTEKPIDQVSVSLSDEDFNRILGDAMEEILSPENYGGRIEVTNVRTVTTIGERTRIIDCLFIPADAT